MTKAVGRISYTLYTEPSGLVTRSYRLHVGRADRLQLDPRFDNVADDRWEREGRSSDQFVSNDAKGRKWATEVIDLEGEEP